jgi:hypothetical protein
MQDSAKAAYSLEVDDGQFVRAQKSMKYRAARRAAIRAAARAAHRRSGLHRLQRNRPILRHELLGLLYQRMSALLAAINWK